MIRRKYIEVSQELKEDLRKRKEALVVSGGALDTEGLEEDVREKFRCKDDGTKVVHRLIPDVRYNAFKGMAKVCRYGGLEAEDVAQWREGKL